MGDFRIRGFVIGKASTFAIVFDQCLEKSETEILAKRLGSFVHIPFSETSSLSRITFASSLLFLTIDLIGCGELRLFAFECRCMMLCPKGDFRDSPGLVTNVLWEAEDPSLAILGTVS
jgi:hypothetical protein